MPPHPDPRDPEVLDGAKPRFADTFARRPSLPHRRLLPDRRAWSVLATTSAVIGCAVLVVPLMARIDVLPDGGGKGDPVAVAEPSTLQSGVLPASPGASGSKDSPATGKNNAPVTGSQGQLNSGGSSGGTGGGLPPVGGTPGGTGGSASGGGGTSGSGGSATGGSGGGSATGGSGGSSGSGSGSSAGNPTPTKTQQTATVPGVRIRSVQSGRCIAVSGAKTSTGRDGARLQIQDCDGGAWQKWDFRSDGTIRAFGMCMDLAGASFTDGAVIQLARCNGGWAQQFRLNTSNDLTNKDKCVDVLDKGTSSGTPLQLWKCYGTQNQKWAKA
ncbi:RICIN domain-containing protein [Actinacidiphila glaucinigra]|uniref:Ricin-type beta-trefoil lectin domain-containing protein n=1 Tax=Actinacidiphila glaucinigra TaxID=235986 RepID=A0A239I6B9_9ACTN|nr:RICIN domain-containing protein [Actinacidiphila glaucinigra]SNS89446.1 Ricin-type beta-trefoil lectin domain-containing protein [Actinacidiphila glaucinigra]